MKRQTMRNALRMVPCATILAATATGAEVVWLGPSSEHAIQLAERDWPKALEARIGGIKLYIDWLRKGTDDELRRMAARVRERGLPVAVEVGGLLNHDWQDQMGEKSAEKELPPLRRWRDAGGRVDVLELDGPIRRAMGFAGWGQDPLKRFTDYKAIARQLHEYLALVGTEFPDVRFHLLVNFPNWGWRGEPSYHARGPKRQDYGDYFEALTAVLPITQAAAPRLSGLTIDHPYDYATGRARSAQLKEPAGVDWLARIADLGAVARTNGLTVGLILNSEAGGKTSDEAFAGDTLAYARLVKQHGLVFERLIVQSWYPQPKTVVGDKLPAQMAVAAEVARLFAWPALGAIRWDFWTAANELDRERMLKDGKVAWGQHRNLQDAQWAGRLPFFAKVVSGNPRRVDIYEDSPEVMDQEIAYAKQAGLSYWAFLHYHNLPGMNRSLELYKKSPQRGEVGYCLILGGTKPYNAEHPWEAQIEMVVREAREASYQRVAGDRPLFFVFLWGKQHTPEWLWGSVQKGRAAMDQLRAGFRRAGLPDPYLVAMAMQPKSAAEYRAQLGLDAVTAYTTFGGKDYAGLAASNVAWWEQAGQLGVPLVLPVSCGWGGPRPDGQPDKQPAAEQFIAHVRGAQRWIATHPQSVPSRALLMYAWNEFDEGGFLCPTQGEPQGARKIDWLRQAMKEDE